MQDLSNPLRHNYLEHPAFRFDSESWGIPAAQLDLFNATYSAARKIGPSLTRESREVFRRDCLHLMNSVFSCMRAQCADDTETQFLTELLEECSRLVNEELDWHFRSLKPRQVRLEKESVRHAAIRMQMERFFFGQLPSVAVTELQELAKNDVERFRLSAAAGKLKRDDLSLSSGATVRAIRGVLNREFLSLGVLDVVSAYTGRKTEVFGLALELSVPQATWWRNVIEELERPPETLYAHIDETISCPKAIVYITDVVEQNGPTGCYPGAYEAMQLNPLQELIGRVVGTVGTRGDSPLKVLYAKKYHQSMNSESFRRHFMRLPSSLRFNSHRGWDVMPGSDREVSLSTNEQKMIGPAGTFIAFDGARLLHRGGLMEAGERVALQVIFSDITFMERTAGKLRRIFK